MKGGGVLLDLRALPGFPRQPATYLDACGGTPAHVVDAGPGTDCSILPINFRRPVELLLLSQFGGDRPINGIRSGAL